MALPLIGMAARAAASSGSGMAAQAVGQAAGQAAGGAAESAVGLLTPLSNMTAAFKGLNLAMSQAEAPFKAAEAFFNHVGSFVAKFSPIRMEFFQRAVADFEAAVGKQLIPILDAGVRAFRRFGDMAMQLAPKMEPVIKAVAGLVEEVSKCFVDLAMDLADIPGLLESVSVGLEVLAKSLKTLLYAGIGTLIMPGAGTAVGATIGAMSSHRESGDSARGMAYQHTQTESVTAMMSRIQQAAYGYSEPAERTAEATTGLLEYFRKDFAKDLSKALKDVLESAPGEAARTGIERIASSIYGPDAGAALSGELRNFSSDPLMFLRSMFVSPLPVI